MDTICAEIVDRTVYPIRIQNGGAVYLTLYYYTAQADAVLHSDRILSFDSPEDMDFFCRENGLRLENHTAEFDFDAPLSTVIDPAVVLDRWNLLNTVARIFGMYFEGNDKKYTPLYDRLFYRSLSQGSASDRFRLSDRQYRQLQKVFGKKDRLLGRVAPYRRT